MFDENPNALQDTRIQLHWASQLMSAAADAKMEKAADDSHSNLAWRIENSSLEGRTGITLNVPTFSIEYQNDVFELRGKTLSDAKVWLEQILDSEVTFRDYEMPEHSVAKDAPFSPNESHLNDIAKWLSFGLEALQPHGECRVWPHHFDLGFWNPGEQDGKSIGGGFSIGDNHFDQPYFYVNPYGIDRPENLPQLKYGHWTEKWTGAVFTADEILATSDPQHAASEYVSTAVEYGGQLLTNN